MSIASSGSGFVDRVQWGAEEQGSALFEVLNAKRMSLEEIADSFVVPPQFEQLVPPDHSYLIGPRGSGKTTLLRMLQGQTLNLWKSDRAAEYRQRIRYSAIFVPADQLWASQTAPDGRAASANYEALITSAFGTQLLIALIESLQYRLDYFESGRPIHLPITLGINSEIELVRECALAWDIETLTPTLNGLVSALDRRLNEIAALLSNVGVDVITLPSWVALEPVRTLSSAVRLVNRLALQPDHRWALLLDEMELAPRAVHQTVVRSVRGGDPNLIFKLSFSPFDNYLAPSNSGTNEPAAENDFRAIYLWSGRRAQRKTGSRPFAKGIWTGIAQDILSSEPTPKTVLGVSAIDASGASWRSEDYAPKSSKMKLLVKMRDQDAGFAAFLKRHEVDLAKLPSLPYEKRSAVVRKVYPLLVYRDALLDFRDGRPIPKRGGSQRPAILFSGEDSVISALEGNPRWMKAVFGRLLSQWRGPEPLGPGVQYDALREAAERFDSLLAVVPIDPRRTDGGRERDDHLAGGYLRFTASQFVDVVASALRARALGSFSADPATIFRVDDRVAPQLHPVLKTALEAGAMIHVRGASSPAVLTNFAGERFRLAYLLSARTGMELPMRLGKSVDLSSLLRGQVLDPERVSRESPTASPTLF